MAITRLEQLDWVDSYFDHVTNLLHVRVKHNGFSAYVVVHQRESIEAMMRGVFEAKRELMRAEQVAKVLSP